MAEFAPNNNPEKNVHFCTLNALHIFTFAIEKRVSPHITKISRKAHLKRLKNGNHATKNVDFGRKTH